MRAAVWPRALIDEAGKAVRRVAPEPVVDRLTGDAAAPGDVSDARAVLEHVFHRGQALLHDTELHEHEGLLRVCRGEPQQRRRWQAAGGGSRGREGVVQVPEPVSPRCRSRVREVSASYRSHGVKDEPESHKGRSDPSARWTHDTGSQETEEPGLSPRLNCTFSGADDGTRTRDAHLGKVAESVHTVRIRPLSWASSGSVSSLSTLVRAVVERSTTREVRRISKPQGRNQRRVKAG